MAVGAILGQRGIQSVNGVQSGVTGNVDLSAGNMTTGINMNSKPLTGLASPVNDNDATDKQYVDNNSSPYNWLDNSNFTNLIAQAGVGGNHGSQAYAADRWILTNGTVSYNAGAGLTLNGTITQKLEFKPTGATSAFVGMQSGDAIINYNSGSGIVTITSSGGVIKWAALYEGTYAEQNKPTYKQKGYSVELDVCMRYYIKTGTLYLPGVNNSASASFVWQYQSKMRAAPTVTYTGIPYIYTPNLGAVPAVFFGASPFDTSATLKFNSVDSSLFCCNITDIILEASADM